MNQIVVIKICDIRHVCAGLVYTCSNYSGVCSILTFASFSFSSLSFSSSSRRHYEQQEDQRVQLQ